MNKLAKKAFRILRDVKSVTLATVNDGEPAARIIDVMLNKEDGLYFITARGKSFYTQLQKTKKIALCCLNKDYVSVRIVGDIRFIDNRKIIDEVFEKNPMLLNLYPGQTRDILEAFHLFSGRGELFDLSSIPMKRKRFSFGKEKSGDVGYVINKNCIACGACYSECPEKAIKKTDDSSYHINQENCIECGRCKELCPVDAIDASSGL